jgi:DNA repair protein RadC
MLPLAPTVSAAYLPLVRYQRAEIPSDSDLRVTRRLAAVAEALDCKLLDHLVFAGESCTSMRRLGLL